MTTALKTHPSLTRYVVCFPFDLTGPTGRKGRSGSEKFEDWKREQIANAKKENRKLTIEAWPAFKLRELVLKYDTFGGIREFFFNRLILTTNWFSEHITLAMETAGPRYTPEINVQTDLSRWCAAFGRTAVWYEEFTDKLKACRKLSDKLASALDRPESASGLPVWPEDLRAEAKSTISDLATLLGKLVLVKQKGDIESFRNSNRRLEDLIGRLISLELSLLNKLQDKHGEKWSDSPGFRQFMAEYMCSFPAANLDKTRETIASCKELNGWLCSPACSLAYEDVFVLSGIAGSGKTHGSCDIAKQRLSEGLLTCITFGHEFGGEPDPGVRLLENLRLPSSLGMNGLLDLLNAAGEASGSPLLLCIDAINETRPLRYWRERLSAVSYLVQQRPYLRLVVTCRTPFIRYCLPDGHQMPIIKHAGFTGVEREACQVFFQHYELEPPISPILQPELSNPLYLKLLCETLQSRGLRHLPAGWHGLAPTIRAFLQEKERKFAVEYDTSENANVIGGSLMAIVRAITDMNDTAISLSQARKAITKARFLVDGQPVLDWLVRSDLLIEDPPPAGASLDAESIVRPAFERLGDFLLASEFLEKSNQMGFDTACQSGELLHSLWKDSETIEKNQGILSALSILVAEPDAGFELPDVVNDEAIYNELMQITIQSFPSREPNTFSLASASLIRKALGRGDYSFDAMDAALATAWSPSTIDAFWLDRLLKQKPLAERDAYWCSYLHDRFETRGIVHRLINAAFELPLDRLELEIAERWSVMLFWFTAAADRRVKDEATRAAVAILNAQPTVIPGALQRVILCDDDEVKERSLLCCYGALIFSRDTDVIRRVTSILSDAYSENSQAFENAMLRDHIKCIGELAHKLGALPSGYDPESTMRPMDSTWPLEIPTENQVKIWGEQLNFMPNEFWSDFYKYSMNCLSPWEHAIAKDKMGKWILRRIIRDFGYDDSGCEKYDDYMLGNYGGGRSKPVWAERIGKKYQWVAMYQLASRLQDHVDRQRNNWEPELTKPPLILAEERKIDPTLPSNIVAEQQDFGNWWMNSVVDLDSGNMLSDNDWIINKAGIPELDELLSIKKHKCQNWRLLVSYPVWRQRDEKTDLNNEYRLVWMNIESYLVPRQAIATAYDSLHRRNFYGRWMPGNFTSLYGFAGEYPWSTLFQDTADMIPSLGDYDDTELPMTCEPSWHQLNGEWEYDASLPRYLHTFVPAMKFFTETGLWWNGQDGYRISDNKTIFQDPSIMEAGPGALIADNEELLRLLNKLGLCILWTLLGEKCLIDTHRQHQSKLPIQTFSQIAILRENGSLKIGERVFFDDYNKDQGPKWPH